MQISEWLKPDNGVVRVSNLAVVLPNVETVILKKNPAGIDEARKIYWTPL